MQRTFKFHSCPPPPPPPLNSVSATPPYHGLHDNLEGKEVLYDQRRVDVEHMVGIVHVLLQVLLGLVRLLTEHHSTEEAHTVIIFSHALEVHVLAILSLMPCDSGPHWSESTIIKIYMHTFRDMILFFFLLQGYQVLEADLRKKFLSICSYVVLWCLL